MEQATRVPSEASSHQGVEAQLATFLKGGREVDADRWDLRALLEWRASLPSWVRFPGRSTPWTRLRWLLTGR
jgi:hypothetical protein